MSQNYSAMACAGVTAPISWRIRRVRLWPATEQVALVQVLADAQPGAAHATAIEIVGEGTLDQFGAQLEGLTGDS